MNKWERQPFRVGMLAGFTLIPLLALVQEALLRRATGGQPLTEYDLHEFFFPGAFYGAILGGCALLAWVNYRKGDYGNSKWSLLLSGGIIFLLTANSLKLAWINDTKSFLPPSFYVPGTSKFGSFIIHQFNYNLPLYCALLMLILGLLMRPKR